jgi:hypothetical protein
VVGAFGNIWVGRFYGYVDVQGGIWMEREYNARRPYSGIL